ncbi:competence/damage-inducible protein A [Psychrobacillus lasiicapitis]|uniref:Putative competence-damage inducible protein n=1 Tax=Psychrobacillus lasiicapitis TaxID=1636719 RepID=A0A544STK4_9BACI|nr:competence/damage-inducible protein A [Psychrobacillus lasiicapitis]TQR08465.1 competence/damage-inducible protein A [Psychrobacillus lasiicapitis]
MKAEIIAVGSELLLGQISNTNARFISSQLAELGIDVYYHSVVGDNPDRLVESIKIAENRADLIIFTGGLGPTKDDLTKETISKHLNKNLVSDQHALIYIEDFFKRMNRNMTENNKKQALVLEGCTVLENKHGMAPGMFLSTETHSYILLPGPPKEMEPMFQFEAKPILSKLLHNESIIKSHVMRFYGIGEAELETEVQDLLYNQTNPTLAPLASDGEVTLRLTAKSETEEEAWKLIDVLQTEIYNRVGKFVYGYNNDSLASKLRDILVENNLTISAAESMTAGLFQAELAAVSGMGQALVGGMITYTEAIKIHQLGVNEETISEYSVVSSQCAEEMAIRVREKFDTNIGVGITGAAGPDGHGGQPAGTVWIGIAFDDAAPVSYKLSLSGMRNTNRLRAVKFTIHYLIRLLHDRGL